jgi:hypothetical protein
MFKSLPDVRVCGPLHKLVLPTGDLNGKHVMMRGKLGHGLLALQGIRGTYPGVRKVRATSMRNCGLTQQRL